MPTLLVSLGTSPAVVPEAFLLPGVDFTAVHVLTTESTLVDFVTGWFRDHAPDVVLTITRVSGFTDFRSEEDHFRFEEVLYRWWLEKVATSLRLDGDVPPGLQPALGRRDPHAANMTSPVSQAGRLLPHVCLSGGFKTMSAAMQKAAAVLGAAEVFHVLCDLPQPQQPRTAEEIEAARAGGNLHWIRLGSETGWPQFRQITASEYPLQWLRDEGTVRAVAAPDSAFRDHLRQIVERSHNIAGAWDRISSLPFPALATWAAEDLAWLDGPLDADTDRAWIQALPKVELHCHLGGFATHGDLLREVRAHAENPKSLPTLPETAPPASWPRPAQTIALDDYMRLGDANGSKLLKDPGCLRRQIELLYDHLCAQNIVYAEVRCSPNNYSTATRSAWTVLTEIRDTFQHCMEVAAAVPGAASAPIPPPPAESESHRHFIPYDHDKPYHQSWRDLPHRHQTGTTAFVTFRLADSLPAEKLLAWHQQQTAFLAAHPKPWDETTWKAYNRQFPQRLEEWLDQPHGECLLKNPNIAASVEAALRHFDGKRYILDAFAIMPNHVHVLVKPLPGHSLDQILHSWKSYTAKEINQLLGRSGQVWEHESFDHLIRSGKQLERIRHYILSNPEKAGLSDGFIVGGGIGLVVAPSGALSSRGTPDATASTSGTLLATSPACHVNLLVIATRKDGGDRSDISRHLSLAITAAQHWGHDGGCRVVGVDLAGFENKDTRAALFATDFEPAHRVGLAVTVHAGENDDAEGIWQAVFKLSTLRIGHALHLIDAPDLMRAVADRRIGVEMCPYANYQIKGFAPMPGKPAYPLKRYLDAGVAVTVNTDNIGISAASLTENFLLLAELCPGITRLDVLRLIRNSMNQAFVYPRYRTALFAQSIPMPP